MVPRIRILMCGHPNPLGCPNHGDVAREIWYALRRQFCNDMGYVFVFGSEDTEPIPYRLTARGRRALRDAGVPLPLYHDWPF